VRRAGDCTPFPIATASCSDPRVATVHNDEQDCIIRFVGARQAALPAPCTTQSLSCHDEAPALQNFAGAERIVGSLGGYPAEVTCKDLAAARIVQDDRLELTVTDTAVYFHIPEGEEGKSKW
jgi:hypothetical protein